MNLTRKQKQILQTVVRGNDDGTFLDMDQLLERVPYRTSKTSMQFSVRYLAQKGLLVKHPLELRRGRMRLVISATQAGYEVMQRLYPRSEGEPGAGAPLDEETQRLLGF